MITTDLLVCSVKQNNGETYVQKSYTISYQIYIILYKYQFGFRENHSTTMALTEIVDNILKDLENGKYVAGIYLDLSKAFDTVDHVLTVQTQSLWN